MSIHNRKSIRFAGSTLHLPPFRGSMPIITPSWMSANEPIPFSSMAGIYNAQHGWTIDVAFRFAELSPSDALTAQAALINALKTTSHQARTVDFCNWYDTAGTIKQIYRNCVVIDGPHFGDEVSEKFRPCEFTLLSRNPGQFATFSDGSTPGVSPWEQYLYNGAMAEGGEEIEEPTGWFETVPTVDTYYLGGTFTGVAEITDDARVQHVRIPDLESANFIIKSIKIIGCSVTGEDVTTIKVSDEDWEGSGNTITASVAAGSHAGSRVTGSIELAAGTPIYVFITAAGGHANVQYEIAIEAA